MPHFTKAKYVALFCEVSFFVRFSVAFLHLCSGLVRLPRYRRITWIRSSRQEIKTRHSLSSKHANGVASRVLACLPTLDPRPFVAPAYGPVTGPRRNVPVLSRRARPRGAPAKGPSVARIGETPGSTCRDRVKLTAPSACTIVAAVAS